MNDTIEEHPIVGFVRTLARHGSTEKFVFDADAQAKIEEALSTSARDPATATAVRQLFELAAVLHHEHASPSAAFAILMALHTVAPKLPQFTSPAAMRAERARREFDQLVGEDTPRVAPSAEAPEGAVKASSFVEQHAPRTGKGHLYARRA
jgi:hypothetical protein